MSSGQTVVLYNHIRLMNCITERFSEEAVFDPSGTDLMFKKFTVTVSGYITGEDLRVAAMKRTQNGIMFPSSLGGYPSITSSVDVHHNPTNEEVALRSVLMEPRHDFEMWEGCDSDGTFPKPDDSNKHTNARPLLIGRAYRSGSGNDEFRKVSPDGSSPEGIGAAPFLPLSTEPTTSGTADYGAYDVNNGPKCLSCDVSRVINNTLFRIVCTFEVCKMECDVKGQVPNNKRGVLSNRWSVSDSIDGNMTTVRTISGQLRVTTPYLNANQFRGWVVPALQPGFRRESIQFTVTADGLWLNYVVTDRETHYSAPPPATSWDYRYRESSGNGRSFEVAVDVTLRGPRNVSKRQLYFLAFGIALNRIYDAATGQVDNIVEANSVDTYSDNDSSIMLSVRAMKSRPGDALIGLGGTSIGKPLTSAEIAGGPLAAAFAAEPILTKPYDETLSRGGYTADPVDIAGKLPVISAWTCYLQTACDQDHNTGNPTFTPVVDGADALFLDSFDFDLSTDPPTNLKRADYSPDSVRVANWIAPTTAAPTEYVSSAHMSNAYTHWQMDTTVEEDRLKVQLPVASAAYLTALSSTSSVVGMVSNGVTRRIVRAKGTRIGSAPMLPKLIGEIWSHVSGQPTPAPTSGGDPPDPYRGELIDATIKHDTPERTIDGKLLFTSYVELVYSVANPLANFTTGQLAGGGGYRIGFNPWEQTPGDPVTSAPVHTTGTTAFSVAP